MLQPISWIGSKESQVRKIQWRIACNNSSFLIINGFPDGQQWYMQYISHGLWNNMINTFHLPKEFSLGMMPGETMEGMTGMSGMNMTSNQTIPLESIPIIIAILIGSPFALYSIHEKRRKKEVHVMKDLVCGMEVSEKKYSSKLNGKDYLFCCAHCKTTFEANPKKFVKE